MTLLADTEQLTPASRWLLTASLNTLPAMEFDVVVVGSGIAGLTAALHASETSRVALVTKGRLAETNTWYAQGGIAGAIGEADSVELHLADTLVVGQGICDENVVRAVVAEAPDALRELRSLGMRFDLEEGGEVALAREGGHSLPRVLHSGDATGAAVQQTLTETIAANDRIAVFEQRFLVDLLTDADGCNGLLVLDASTGKPEVFSAGAVILATGGAGQVFSITTNPLIATGDGVAAAWRAGARIGDHEFVQFHPTALDHDAAPRFLVSEALRGEGAYLLDCEQERFMVGVHPLAELAPRDVVSRQIEQVMSRCGRKNVWLDARHLGGDYLHARFPNIWQACADAGYNLGTDLVPVAPAAHYSIGGAAVDIDGRTSIPGLYASGEVAMTGLHGANRLASNSLLEGLVFSRRIARALEADKPKPRPVAVDTTTGWQQCGDVSAAQTRKELQGAAQELLGMTRTADGLARMRERCAELRSQMACPQSVSELETANLLGVAALIAASADARLESRGCHSRLDYPDRDDEHWRGHVLWQANEPARFVPTAEEQCRQQ